MPQIPVPCKCPQIRHFSFKKPQASCQDQLRAQTDPTEEKSVSSVRNSIRQKLKKQFSSSSSKSKKDLLTRTRSKSQSERNVTITTLLIIIIFTCCYFLNYFFIFNYFIYLVTGQMIQLSKRYFDFMEMLYYFLININSVFNPIIYILRNTCFKNELRNIWQELFDEFRKIGEKCGLGKRQLEVYGAPPAVERFVTLRTSQV